jgi:hypothetical protein
MASRICPHCGQEAPHSARFCSQCSSSLVGPATTTMGTQPINSPRLQQAAQQSKVVLIASIGAALVVVIGVGLFLYVKATSVVHATPPIATPAAPLVQAPQTMAPASPLVQAPSTDQTAPPLTQAPTTTTPGPPQDIVNYLAFVQQTEEYRANLENEQTAAVLPLLGTAQGMKNDAGDDDNGSAKQAGTNQINQGMTDNLVKWQQLAKTFQAQSAPADCEILANNYFKLLNDYTNLCSEIQVALANGDYAKILGLQSGQTVVDQDASNADGALSDICIKFGIKKSFTISTGSASGTSLLGN